MKGKIVFEEHIAIEETLGRAKAFAGEFWALGRFF